MSFTPHLYIQSKQPLNIHTTLTTSVTGLPCLQTLYGAPYYLYLFTDSKFFIYQLKPYKQLATFKFKQKIIDYNFTSDGKYLMILTPDSLLFYDKNQYCGRILGNFENYKIEVYQDEVILLGNFNIFIFDGNKRPETLFKTEGDFNLFYREEKKGIAYFKNSCVCAWSNNFKIYIKILENETFAISCDFRVKKIVCDIMVSRLYCLSTDGDLHILRLDGTKSSLICSEVLNFNLSFCEKYCYVVCKQIFKLFEDQLLIDEVNAECEENFVVTIKGCEDKGLDYIKVLD